MISTSSRILLARQLAGLRHQKWKTIDAVGFVAAALPPGELRAVCDRALQSMRVGTTETPRSSDPLEHALSRGEQAGPETFEFIAEALEARELSRSGQESGAQLARLLIAGPLVLGALFGWGARLGSMWNGVPLPAITELELTLISVLKWSGLPLAVLAWFMIPRWFAGLSPGGRNLQVAARLFEFAAGDTLGPREFGLMKAEQQFFAWRESAVGPAAAARDLGAQLVLDGRQAIASFNRFAPVFAALVGLILFNAVAVPLLTPVFTIAGAIK